jgi:hypothetical protein
MAAASIDDLLALPMLALLAEPMSAGTLADAVSGDGLELGAERAGDLLARLESLGLARVTGYEAGEARYVRTSLGERAVARLIGTDSRAAYRPRGARTAAGRPRLDRRA